MIVCHPAVLLLLEPALGAVFPLPPAIDCLLIALLPASAVLVIALPIIDNWDDLMSLLDTPWKDRSDEALFLAITNPSTENLSLEGII
jgi:hypothetical protein